MGRGKASSRATVLSEIANENYDVHYGLQFFHHCAGNTFQVNAAKALGDRRRGCLGIFVRGNSHDCELALTRVQRSCPELAEDQLTSTVCHLWPRRPLVDDLGLQLAAVGDNDIDQVVLADADIMQGKRSGQGQCLLREVRDGTSAAG